MSMPATKIIPLFVVCRALKTPHMKAHGFSYYHAQCWDWEEPYTLSQLSLERAPVPDGFVRLEIISDIGNHATCCACEKSLLHYTPY